MRLRGLSIRCSEIAKDGTTTIAYAPPPLDVGNDLAKFSTNRESRRTSHIRNRRGAVRGTPRLPSAFAGVGRVCAASRVSSVPASNVDPLDYGCNTAVPSTRLPIQAASVCTGCADLNIATTRATCRNASPWNDLPPREPHNERVFREQTLLRQSAVERVCQVSRDSARTSCSNPA